MLKLPDGQFDNFFNFFISFFDLIQDIYRLAQFLFVVFFLISNEYLVTGYTIDKRTRFKKLFYAV